MAHFTRSGNFRTPLITRRSPNAFGASPSFHPANGVLPFTNYHRLHVVPPCIITADEAREGLAAIDKALTTIGHHYVAS